MTRAIAPKGNICLVQRLRGDELSEFCLASGYGAASDVIELLDGGATAWCRVLAVAPRRSSPGQLVVPPVVGQVALVADYRAQLELPDGRALIEECAIVAQFDGDLRVTGAWTLFKESEEAQRAFYGDSARFLTDAQRERGLAMAPADTSAFQSGWRRVAPVWVLATGAGHYSEPRPNTPTVFGGDWVGMYGMALIRMQLARELFRRDKAPLYFAPSPSIVAMIE